RSNNARLALSPFRSDMERYMSTTSGESSRAWRSASRPSTARDTTSMSGCVSTTCLSPSATTPWSSAMMMRIVMSEGHRGADRCSISRRRLDQQPPPCGLRALAHGGHAPAPARRSRGVEAFAVVADSEHELTILLLQAHSNPFSRRMFRRVVERLLRYPEQRHRGLGAQARARLARLDPDPDPGALRVFFAVPRKRGRETVLVE